MIYAILTMAIIGIQFPTNAGALKRVGMYAHKVRRLERGWNRRNEWSEEQNLPARLPQLEEELDR